jgi:superfamily II DNA/RNA helicase
LKRPIQQLFFSATYSPDVIDYIANIVEKANTIKLDIGAVHLPNIQQFYYKFPPKGKIDFIKEICGSFTKSTQIIIFVVNTKNFAYKLFRSL